MRRIVRQLFRSPWLVAYLRGAYQESKTRGLCAELPETTVAEATPLACRISQYAGCRLNLLVPALAIEHVFGGITTALHLFETLAEQAKLTDLRIILTEQQSFRHEDNPRFACWDIRTLDDHDGPGRCVVAAGDRYGKTLAVGSGDRFVATAWWTAISARSIQSWQRDACVLSKPAPYIYLIQDYEPGFYPWSSRYALAEATYHNAEHYVAVFNTSLLHSFFIRQGYLFPQAYSFEPLLHPVLRQQRELLRGTNKERRLLVYGRPGTLRNAFELVVMGLRQWVANNGGGDWSFVSVGEAHVPICLGSGKQLVSLGKLSIEEYAAELSRAALGLSLMISPHPSYPPLEMAAFGVQVVTNQYGPKDLGALHSTIHSTAVLTPEAIAEKLDFAAQRAFEQQQAAEDTPQWRHYLTGDTAFAALSAPLLARLFQ